MSAKKSLQQMDGYDRVGATIGKLLRSLYINSEHICRLVWHPAQYSNLTKIHVPHDKIWKPDIVLYNNAASEYLKSVMSTDVVVSYDGNVSWTMAGIFQSSCG
jgi:hypothetical protein